MAKRKAKPLIQVKRTVGRSFDGKAIRKSFYGHTKREANAKADEYILNNKFETIDKNITLAAWAEKWLAVYKKGKVSDKTYKETYELCVENRIKPYFGEAKLAAIKPVDIQDFFNSINKHSQSHLDKTYTTIKAIFRTAVDNDLITKSPVVNINVVSLYEPAETRAYTAKQAAAIIDYAKTHKHGLPIIFILKTGMRPGEFLALQWPYVYVDDKLVQIEFAVTSVNGHLTIGPPKTKSSKATIPFDDELYDVLKGLPGAQNGLVWPNSIGGVMDPHNWRARQYTPFMEGMEKHYKKKGIDIPIYTPKELRHTYGSLIYEATNDIYITSKLMRHANVEITAGIYVHEQMDTRRDALSKVSQMISKTRTELGQKVPRNSQK